jgi:PPM family protein phosphatase
MNSLPPNSFLIGLGERLVSFLGQPPARSVRLARGYSAGLVKGPVRPENQDRAVVAQITNDRQQKMWFALVCDGMGGLERGGEAATLAASAFIAQMTQVHGQNLKDKFHDAVFWANRVVYDKLRGRGGTTLTALMMPQSSHPWCVHVGDSRLYERRGHDDDFKQLSRDDTLEGVLSNGTLSDDLPSNGLLQFVGMGDDLQPHIEPISSARNSTFLLTTDGVHGMQSQTFRDICRASKTTEELTKRLLLVAEALGARDNATVIATRPDEFVGEAQFATGTSLIVWTPSERLDIWLPSDSGIVDRPVPPDSQHKLGPSSRKPAKHTKKKKARKPAPEEPGLLNKAGEEKPQLRIELDSDKSESDD